MRTSSSRLEPREIRGRDVLHAMLAFFAVVFAVNGYFLYAALRTHTGVVAVEPYRKGLAYNERIAAEEQQTHLGWGATIDVGPEGRVAVSFADRGERAVVGLAVTGLLGRPATGQQDRALHFSEVRPGRYVAETSVIEPGSWILALEARQGGSGSDTSYRLRRRLWLKP